MCDVNFENDTDAGVFFSLSEIYYTEKNQHIKFDTFHKFCQETAQESLH